MYSPVPGVYIHHDYASAEHFHDITIADRFTISEGGKTIIDARTESVSDAPPKNSNLFLLAGLNPVGAGEVMEVPTLVTGTNGSPVENTNVEVVVVHDVLSPDGKLNEAKVLTRTNLSLDEPALKHAAEAPMLRMDGSTQSGAATHPREIVFTEKFVPRRPLPTGSGVGPTGLSGLGPGVFPPTAVAPPQFPPLPPNSQGVITCGSCVPTGSQPPPVPPNAPRRVKIGGQVEAAKIIAQPQPVYPPLALQARIQGDVVLHAIINKEGRVAEFQVISGHPLLVHAAIEAVQQWRYARRC